MHLLECVHDNMAISKVLISVLAKPSTQHAGEAFTNRTATTVCRKTAPRYSTVLAASARFTVQPLTLKQIRSCSTLSSCRNNSTRKSAICTALSVAVRASKVRVVCGIALYSTDSNSVRSFDAAQLCTVGAPNVNHGAGLIKMSCSCEDQRCNQLVTRGALPLLTAW